MKVDAKTKQPFAVTVKDADVIAFAGLWERWKPPQGGKLLGDPGKDPKKSEWLETYTILTTDPNGLMQPIHDRMPVIVAEKDYERWLEPGDAARPPVDLLKPFPEEQMRVWKVGAAVGNVRNDSPELCEQVWE
jgi:putative SOS response-associated peptidase YedK